VSNGLFGSRAEFGNIYTTRAIAAEKGLSTGARERSRSRQSTTSTVSA
jgi:hypothetical protein